MIQKWRQVGRFKARFITLVLVFGVIAAAVVLVGICYADSKYYKKEAQCRNESGGRGDYSSVIYACNRAANGDPSNPKEGQNGCALWIGSASSHGVPTIYASSATGTINVAFWGMCTDKRDTTKSITVSDKEGQWVNNVGIVAKGNLTRGLWARPTSVGGTLNVATFIVGATKTPVGKCGMKYTRTVWVGREHSDGKSRHEMPEIVSVIVPNPDAAEQCKEEEKDLCQRSDWMPSGYRRSLADINYGETFIVVKARNTRIDPSMPSGMWTDLKDKNGGGVYKEEIYARPFDTIIWHSCYYPGIQTKAMTQVSDIDDIYTAGGTGGDEYKEPRSDGGCDPPIVVNYTQLWWGYENKVGRLWENRYSFDENELGPGYDSIEFGHGVYAWQAGFEQGTNYDVKAGSHYLGSEDVGNPDGRTQQAHTYNPRRVDISRWRKPSTYGRYRCGTTEEGGAIYCPCTNYYKNDIVTAEMNNGQGTGDLGIGTGDNEQDMDRVKVLVPYNFENDTDLEVPDNEPIYSGEGKITVSKVTYTVGTRSNGITYDTYATIVPKAKMRLFMYVSDNENAGGEVSDSGDGCEVIDNKQCMQVDGDGLQNATNLELPLNGSMQEESLHGEGPVEWGGERQYNAFDASAGDYLCFVSAIWPASSGIDLQMDPDGDNMWKYSESKCRVIMKKPTFQVWGDSLYSVGGISSNVGEKHNLYYKYHDENAYGKVNGYDLHGNGTTLFSSWVEESIILKNGLTNTVASGAATGWNSGINTPNGYYGISGNGSNFCNGRAPLTFGNGCKIHNEAGNSGIDTTATDREELIRYWGGGSGYSDVEAVGDCNMVFTTGKLVPSASGVNVCYYETSQGLEISQVASQEYTYIIKTTGDIFITADITYDDDKDYTLPRQVPKVVLFANNIGIYCNVKRVDAILIATGTVDTCYDADRNDHGSDYDDEREIYGYTDLKRQTPLKIFGTVMADRIILGRTYGAAAWNGTAGQEKESSDGKAAEVFDYDSSIMIWGEYMSGAVESDTLQTVYQHELAPRY